MHEGDDGPDGLLSWTATGDFNLVAPLGTVEVGDLVSANDIAYRDLWSYLSGIDGIEQVSLSNRPVDEPVRWLLGDGRALVMTQQVDLVWLRLLDVPAALAARRYAIPGDIVIEVIDEDAGGSRRAGIACEPTETTWSVHVRTRMPTSRSLSARWRRSTSARSGCAS